MVSSKIPVPDDATRNSINNATSIVMRHGLSAQLREGAIYIVGLMAEGDDAGMAKLREASEGAYRCLHGK